MKKLYVMAVLAAAVPVQAVASDEMDATFSGPRAEIQLGYDNLGFEFDDGVDQVEGYKKGLSYGLEVGYDHDFGKGVIGLYGNGSLASTKFCSFDSNIDQTCLKASRQFAGGVRLGFKPTDNVLVYGKVGYVNTGLKSTYVDFTDPTQNYSESGSKDGLQFGGGMEARLNSRAYLKAEYMRSEYKSFMFDEVAGIKGDMGRDQITAGLGVRF